MSKMKELDSIAEAVADNIKEVKKIQKQYTDLDADFDKLRDVDTISPSELLKEEKVNYLNLSI